MRFRFIVEELFQYSFEVEADDRDAADDEFEKLTDKHGYDFHAILSDDRTLNGQELDGCLDIQCYDLDESETQLEKLTERMAHEDLDD